MQSDETWGGAVIEVAFHGFADIKPKCIERVGFGKDGGIHASRCVAAFFRFFD
jgi:hypothetical protein